MTHSSSSNGLVPIVSQALDEPQILLSTNAVMLANSNVVLSTILAKNTSGTVTYTNVLDYLVSTGLSGLTSLQRTTNSAIPDGSMVLVSYGYRVGITNAGLVLTVAGDVRIETNGIISVNGGGYGTGQGSGQGQSSGSPAAGGGGRYGGYGGGAGVSPFGSPFEPADLGGAGGAGAGGPGGSGGGMVRLTIGSNLVVNGFINANGLNATNTRAGGGAGGCIRVVAQSFSGTGVLMANGGAGEPIYGNGGSGGRIAIEFLTNNFAGPISAAGGLGAESGGAGTIFLRTTGSSGTVTFDNGGKLGAGTLIDFTNAADLVVQGGAKALALNSQTVNNLLLRSNSFLLPPGSTLSSLVLSNLGDVTIELGAVISGDGNGFPVNQGSGIGSTNSSVGSGSGHGGYGGTGKFGVSVANGGPSYGSTLAPTNFGSGGRSINVAPGGGGGGSIRLFVNGTLRVDGRISVNATAGQGNAGGGSGGSIWMTSGNFMGSGSITANGGDGGLPYGGGGSGGRIAIYFTNNTFTGALLAKGGLGAVTGAAGTIYLQPPNPQSAIFIADNGGNKGTNTVLDVSSLATLSIVHGGSVTPVLSTLTVTNFSMDTNTSFFTGAQLLTVNVFGNAAVATGALFSADATSSMTSGPGVSGAGGNTGGSGGGGSAGDGGGGAGAFNSYGGTGYGSSAAPSLPGSRGGAFTAPNPNGGGAIRMNVSGLLTLDGRITANGQTAFSNNNGGGGGGSIWLVLGGFAGSGSLSANGGSGHLPLGGGGGGGRIAITYDSNVFNGTFSAKGGLGYTNGGAGTIYLKANSATQGDLTVDNGGIVPIVADGRIVVPITRFVEPAGFREVKITGGAVLSGSSLAVSNLTILTNGVLILGVLTVSSNAIIAAGGRLSLDGVGPRFSSQGSGGSAGSVGGGGGGGHGGYGGRGSTANGGLAFGSITAPNTTGGSGGGGLDTARGGGALRMIVSGALLLDGRISASGILTLTNSGGGAGGSLYLTVGGLSGSGTLAADGGPGTFPNFGGGGGGHIAVYYTSNSFTGNFSAKGGAGFVPGGAGTIYTRQINANSGNLLIDNGGVAGPATLLTNDFGPLTNLTITGSSVVTSTVSSFNLTTLNLGSNSSYVGPASLTITVSGAASIASGALLSLDRTGNGNNPGGSATLGSGGGGNGGFGGNGAAAAGSFASGSAFSPTTQGGRGGGNTSGGGALQLTVNGLLNLDGRISANGGSSASNNAGGGAGGSLWLTVGGLAGAGSLAVDGGSGHLPAGGGGGGGRLALYFTSNAFTGTFSALGGDGFVRGGAGTIYLKRNTDPFGTILLDNGGQKGTNTSVSPSGSYDLVVQGGASGAVLGGPRDVLVHSNGFLSHTGPLIITRNATIEAGGGINLDGLGTNTTGRGLSSTTQAGGGGHGGNGGLYQFTTGLAYDSVTNPVQGGSAGGNSSGTNVAPFGGAGGGVLQLTVSNLFTLEGTMSASGNPGDFNSGGGSGGGLSLKVQTLTGHGSISAAGGAGNGTGGGGGGGRVAIVCATNLFAGTVSACGGVGAQAGGAGTIFLSTNGSTIASVVIDNCALSGAPTPLKQSFGFAPLLQIANGAIGEVQGATPIFTNILVASGGSLTANMDLIVLGDLTVQSGALLHADARGFAQFAGLGAGSSLNSKGSGGGHGGSGGASASGAPGGTTYGLVSLPTSRGSGGGAGFGASFGGSEGGGAVRLTVGGRFTLDGQLSANGGDGLQDDSGGGSGGSVWVTAANFGGSGSVSADGGWGELAGGGGGGGGRIALYSPSNSFAGTFSAAGGVGAFNGANGTIYFSSALPDLHVISQSPTGEVSNLVSSFSLVFTSPINPLSVAPNDIILFSPNGPVSSTNISVSLPDAFTLLATFPPQNAVGNYRVEAGPNIQGLLGQNMSQVYTGAFTVALPVISGTVTDTNGQPVAGVRLQQSIGGLSAVTDLNGVYNLGVQSGWTGSVFPSLAGFMFIPGSRAYPAVTNSISGQNYTVNTIAPTLATGLQGTNFSLRWLGLAGVSYQAQVSTNLTNWLPYHGPLSGTNGLIELLIPMDAGPKKFFRVNAAN